MWKSVDKFDKWVWLKIKQEGLRRFWSMFLLPCFALCSQVASLYARTRAWGFGLVASISGSLLAHTNLEQSGALPQGFQKGELVYKWQPCPLNYGKRVRSAEHVNLTFLGQPSLMWRVLRMEPFLDVMLICTLQMLSLSFGWQLRNSVVSSVRFWLVTLAKVTCFHHSDRLLCLHVNLSRSSNLQTHVYPLHR